MASIVAAMAGAFLQPAKDARIFGAADAVAGSRVPCLRDNAIGIAATYAQSYPHMIPQLTPAL
jgi:hypothetical protein